MSYIGNTPTNQNFVAGADQFNGTGSQTVFTLSRNVNTVFDIFVAISNVPQDPYNAYSVSGNTLTFTSAPPAGTGNIYVVYRATNVQTFVPSPGSTVGGPFGIQGNLNFYGTGNRITGDFSNATVANRLMFQTSTVNGITNVGILPNGTGVSALLTAFSSSSDPANASTAQFGLFGTEVRATAGITGTGTYLPMTFYTGGSERMRIDTSGRVTMPYQPAFRAQWSTANFVFGSGVTLWNQVVFDIGSHYNTANGRFTAPVSGTYHFDLQTQHYGGTGSTGFHDIRLNGGDLNCRWEDANAASTYNAGCVSVTVYMNAGDWVDCFSSAPVWWSDNSFFSGFFIG